MLAVSDPVNLEAVLEIHVAEAQMVFSAIQRACLQAGRWLQRGLDGIPKSGKQKRGHYCFT